MNSLPIGRRIAILALAALLPMLVVVGIALHGKSTAIDDLRDLYQERTLPLTDLSKVGELLNENTIELMLALQHDPRSALVEAHPHAVDVHLEHFAKNRAEINALWEKYIAGQRGSEEKRLADDFAAKRKAWVEKATAMLQRIKGGDYSAALLSETLSAMEREGKAALDAHDALMEYQVTAAKTTFETEVADGKSERIEFLLIALVGLAITAGFAWSLGRSIAGSVNSAVGVAETIAGGDLTRAVPRGGEGETGRLLTALGRMQDNLRTMVGSAQQSAQSLTRAADRDGHRNAK